MSNYTDRENEFKETFDKLKNEIKSVKYLLKMDEISLSDLSNPLVTKLFEMESELEELLNFIRVTREKERKELDVTSAEAE